MVGDIIGDSGLDGGGGAELGGEAIGDSMGTSEAGLSTEVISGTEGGESMTLPDISAETSAISADFNASGESLTAGFPGIESDSEFGPLLAEIDTEASDANAAITQVLTDEETPPSVGGTAGVNTFGNETVVDEFVEHITPDVAGDVTLSSSSQLENMDVPSSEYIDAALAQEQLPENTETAIIAVEQPQTSEIEVVTKPPVFEQKGPEEPQVIKMPGESPGISNETGRRQEAGVRAETGHGEILDFTFENGQWVWHGETVPGEQAQGEAWDGSVGDERVRGNVEEELHQEFANNPDFRQFFEELFSSFTQEQREFINQYVDDIKEAMAENPQVIHIIRQAEEDDEDDEDIKMSDLMKRLAVKALIAISMFIIEKSLEDDPETREIGKSIKQALGKLGKSYEQSKSGESRPNLSRDVANFLRQAYRNRGERSKVYA